eukprot:scaffold14091_cov121-Isochrysis_galbana.AAC.5
MRRPGQPKNEDLNGFQRGHHAEGPHVCEEFVFQVRHGFSPLNIPMWRGALEWRPVVKGMCTVGMGTPLYGVS